MEIVDKSYLKLERPKTYREIKKQKKQKKQKGKYVELYYIIRILLPTKANSL